MPAPSLRESYVGAYSNDRETAATDLWGRCRMQWQFGDWESLAQTSSSVIESDPMRGYLSLLVACACQQLGDHESARRHLRNAADWGCDRRRMVELLVAGVHNTLGRMAVIGGDETRAFKHFRDAVTGLADDPKLVFQARTLRELSSLGFLCSPNSDGTVSTRLDQRGAPLSKAGRYDLALPAASDLAAKKVDSVPNIQSPASRSGGIVSYAQNLEDVLLWRALGHISKGFYVDIGAQHPIIDSVSQAFYERGWRGLHVEPTRAYADLLRQARPDEKVIQALVSNSHEVVTFYEIPETGMSTGDHSIASAHRAKGFVTQEVKVPSLTLADVLAECGNAEIHWLKIDVEGFEQHVLEGWGRSDARPWVVVVESIWPGTQLETHETWEAHLLKRDYSPVFFDGLSRFYLHANHADLTPAFRTPPNVFDNYTLFRSPPSCQ